MLKVIVIGILLTSCVVLGQHGSFLGGTKKPLCGSVGNYCQENADCCDKACNVESRKCIINLSPRPSTQSPLVNRFGEEGVISPCQHSGAYCQLGRDCCSGECQAQSLTCVQSNNIEKYPNQVTNNGVVNSGGFQGQQSSTNEDSSCSKTNQQCSSSRGCCAFLSCEGSICRDNAVVVNGTETVGFQPGSDLVNRFGEEEKVPQIVTSRPNVKCSEAGSKCYKLTDCCQGLKCHGFLHQCVT